MEKQQRAALVFAGPVSRGTLNRLPGLPEQLEYVKSSSVATASRAVQALRCGRTVHRLDELEGVDLLILSVPDRALPATVAELLKSGLPLAAMTVVLYDSHLSSTELELLRDVGAHVASLSWHARPEQFVAEGDAFALRRIRSLTGKKTLLILRSKESYLRALRSTTEDFYPVLASAVQGLREAGMEKGTAERMAASLIDHSARVFLRAGRRGRTPPPQAS